MRKRIVCPFHAEQTASLVQYGENWHCFGACSKNYTNKEVEERSGKTYEFQEDETEEKEDIQETFAYIRSLPVLQRRGLLFPTDQRGYFVCWPKDEYYKYRRTEPRSGPKYVGAAGKTPPLFWGKRLSADSLYITEGEINCLSLALAFPEADHCSPGSASMFNADNLNKYLPEFKKYSNVIVVLDNDAAGTKALIEAKAFFLYKIPFLSFVQLSLDANEILQNVGAAGLRKEMSRSDLG